MKRILAIILAALMCVSTLALAACSSKTTSGTPEQPNSPSTGEKPTEGGNNNKPSTPVKPDVQTDDDGSTPNNIFTNVTLTYDKVEEHKVADTLPESATLVGTDYLPPVDNQGEIGSCASQAITYLQYTNAVAQYEHKLNPNSTWKPATSYDSCFSPKWSFQFAGASTGAVYMFLRDHGALTNKVDAFAKNTQKAHIIKRGTTLQTQTTRWVLDQGLGEQALEYRLTNHEQYWVTDTNGVYWNKDKTEDGVVIGVQFTTSDAGKELLYKIKDAIASGHVVVTGGYPSTWQTEKLTAASGTAKKGDTVITHAAYNSANGKGGGHQVAIVGYDDNIEYKVPGTTDQYMKGAFLIQNSYGTSWHNGGYTWMFYDAVNTISEHENFKIPSVMTRDWALDQFCFIYWDRDITAEMPGMYAELEIETTNRDALNVELGRTDAYGRYVGSTPYMFYYYGNRPNDDYKAASGVAAGETFYLNGKGEVNGGATTGYYTVSFQRLLDSMPDNTGIENYKWSIKVTSKNSDETGKVTVKSMVVKNAKGEVLKTLKFDAETISKNTNTYVFDLGGETAKGILSGNYTFQNVGTGKYLAKESSMTFKVADKAADALEIKVAYDSTRDSYLLWRPESGTKTPTYVMDIVETVTSGAKPQFNAENSDPEQETSRATTQNWKVSHNADSSISLYITTAKGTQYALAVVDGVVCLKKATELTDDMKWTATSDTETTVTSTVTASADGLAVNATVAKKVTKVNIVVTDAEGKVVASQEADAANRAVSATVNVTAAGTYVVKVLNAEDGAPAATFTVVTIK